MIIIINSNIYIYMKLLIYWLHEEDKDKEGDWKKKRKKDKNNEILTLLKLVTEVMTHVTFHFINLFAFQKNGIGIAFNNHHRQG